MTALVFLDTETTSLDADTGEIWEVGAIVRQPDGTETEHHWFLPVTLAGANPVSLDIGRFHERYPDDIASDVTPMVLFCAEFFHLTDNGAHLVGNVISFDEERLRRLLLRCGITPGWHYHLVDVEALAAGRLRKAPPWSSSELTEALGLQVPDEATMHTAVGDARWAMQVYDAVMGGDRD